MGDVPRDPRDSFDDDSLPRVDRPEQLCDAIAAIIETLEENELLDEDDASELRSDVYNSVKLATHPEEEEVE